MLRFGFRRVTGFTLIEVLVSTIILAIGLLGLASMQTLALKDNQDAFFYAQASSLAYEMADRIKANSAAWQGAILPSDSSDCSDSCNSIAHTCTPGQMADYDYCAWKKNVVDRITVGASATVTVSPLPTLSPVSAICTDTSGSRRCITVSWGRSKNLGAQTTNRFQLEITP